MSVCTRARINMRLRDEHLSIARVRRHTDAAMHARMQACSHVCMDERLGRQREEEPRRRRAAEAAQGVGVGAGEQRWQSGLEQVCACAVRARECVRCACVCV